MPLSTLGAIVNAGLKEVGEPIITALTAGNILELALIEAANNAITELNAEEEYSWAYGRTTLTTAAKITTENVAVTNGSTTITSVTSAGVDAANWTSAEAGMYIRVGTDQTSYQLSSVSLAGTPHTAVLETAYVGTTDTAASYTLLKDTYPITDTDFDEVKVMSYGNQTDWLSATRGQFQGRPMSYYNTVDQLVMISGADLHRDTSGKPFAFAPINVNSSDQSQLVMYPYPDDQYVLQMWYKRKFSDLSTFAGAVFGTDAPDMAYLAVEYGVRGAACRWDENATMAQYWDGKRDSAFAQVKARENRAHQAQKAIKVFTGRRSYGKGMEGRSQVAFDTVPLHR